MLDVTPSASQVIRELVVRNDGSGGGGLRIAPTQTEGDFSLSVAGVPEPDDHVVTAQDVEVFLEPTAAAALDDKVLDASISPEGKVSFTVANQTGTDFS